MRTTLYATPDLEQWLRFWGAAEDAKEQDRRIVDKISVVYRNAVVYVPLSAYADLASPRIIQISNTNNICQVIIRGGDASASYTATLVIEGDAITSRKVVDGENDKEYEVTQYYFSPLDDR